MAGGRGRAPEDADRGVEDRVAKLGAKGFKVDFIDRGDAEAERFIWKFAESCYRNRMIVNYHGVHRPTGLGRAYPNVLNYEGVHGLEQMKWFDGNSEILADDVKLCFTRSPRSRSPRSAKDGRPEVALHRHDARGAPVMRGSFHGRSDIGLVN